MNRKQLVVSHWIWDGVLLLGCFIVLGFSIYLSLTYPRVILDQGLSHRIFYFHVPVAWVALYGPLFASVASILYLIQKQSKWDRIGFSFNLVSLVFALGVLVSGPIWAYSAWGVSWDWTDARLQSFFVLCLSLGGYFIVRNLIQNQSIKEFTSAYLTLLCAVNAILTWGAIRWIDNPGNHPSSVLGEGGMDQDMRVTFYLCVLGYHLLFLLLFKIVYRFNGLKEFAEDIKSSLDE